MLNLDFLEKGLAIIPSSHFMYSFSREMFLMLYSINFIAWFSLLFEVLFSMCIPIVCYPRCGVTHFEIKLVFLIKLFFHLTKPKSQNKNFNILRMKRAIKVK